MGGKARPGSGGPRPGSGRKRLYEEPTSPIRLPLAIHGPIRALLAARGLVGAVEAVVGAMEKEEGK